MISKRTPERQHHNVQCVIETISIRCSKRFSGTSELIINGVFDSPFVFVVPRSSDTTFHFCALRFYMMQSHNQCIK